jgi:cytochrome oxidase Cu insertion factor (SCO1/SenC/PrrC family)
MKHILFTLILSCISSGVFSHEKTVSLSNQNAVRIRVVYSKDVQKDMLFLDYAHNYWGSIPDGNKFQAKVDIRNNSFYFEIDKGSKACYFFLYRKNQYGVHLNFFPLFIAEPGDNIKINASKDSFSFEGKGSAKYQCQYDISKVKNKVMKYLQTPFRYNKNNGQIIVDSLYYTNFIDQLERTMKVGRETVKLSLELLEKYKPIISEISYNLIKADIIAREEISNYGALEYPYTIFSAYPLPKFKDRVDKGLSKMYSTRVIADFKSIPSKYLHLSNGYLTNLIAKANDTILNKKSGYQMLKNNYKGLLRERLVSIYFLRYFAFKKNATADVNDALTYVKTVYCRKILSSFSTLNPNQDAYNFTLPDSSGRIVRMADLKGKVVLMDFWFTGCMGCKMLAKQMKPVIEHFKNNNSIVFVSISIDKDLEKWKFGLRSNEYTHDGGINLYTEGLAEKSEIINHYNIVAYPTIIIVDKNGKIITGNPPRPDNPKDEKALIALIQQNI